MVSVKNIIENMVIPRLKQIALIQSKAYSEGAGSFKPGEAIPKLTEMKKDAVQVKRILVRLEKRVANIKKQLEGI